MADDNNPRYPHDGDPFARAGSPPAPRGTVPPSDPLAELARLIGQNDPFADFGRESARSDMPAHQHAPSHQQAWPGEGPMDDWGSAGRQPAGGPYHDERAYRQDQYGEERYRELGPDRYADTGAAGFSEPGADRYAINADQYANTGDRYADPYAQPADPYSLPGAPAYHDHDPFADPAGYSATHQHRLDSPHPDDMRLDDGRYAQGGEAHLYTDQGEGQAYGQHPADAPGYGGDPYGRDAPIPPHRAAYRGDAYGEEPAPRRRSGLVVVMAVFGLAVVGTAAAFGYRAMFGPSGANGAPPVIRADSTPSKVVPAAQNNDSQSGKVSQDRVGDRAQGEKVVVREEQPVDMKDAPKPATARGVFPAVTGAPASSPAASPPASAAAPASAAQVAAANEPKKVRTVIIRPDKSGGFNTVASVPRPGQPASNSGASPFPDPPPAPTRTRAAAAQAPPSGNEPLALAPRNAPASDPAPRARVAAAPSPPAPRTSAAASAPAGSYAVQVSSQRSEADAQASYRALQAKFPNQLGSRDPIIRRADLGDKGTFFRALVGPFSSSEQAAEFCNGLKAAGGQCLIQRN